MKTSIRIVRDYDHPVEKVWKAITTPELMERWLMPNDFLPVEGHQFTFRTEPAPGFDGVVHCEVLEVVEPSTLRFSWRGGPIDTIASFQISATETGTRLVFLQTGFVGAKGWLVSKMLKMGSRKIYGRLLPKVLDQLPGTQDCQNVPEVHPEPEPNSGCGPWFKRVFGWFVRRMPDRSRTRGNKQTGKQG